MELAADMDGPWLIRSSSALLQVLCLILLGSHHVLSYWLLVASLVRPRSHLLYGEDMAAVRPLN